MSGPLKVFLSAGTGLSSLQDKPVFVQKTQVALKRMRNGAPSHDGPLDGHALGHQLGKGLRLGAQTKSWGIDESIEGAAIGDIIAHGSEPRQFHGLVQRRHEGGHIVKRDRADPIYLIYDMF